MRLASAALGMPQVIDVQKDAAAALFESQVHLADALGTGLAGSGPAVMDTPTLPVEPSAAAGPAAGCEQGAAMPSVIECVIESVPPGNSAVVV